jgi:hypothetical protein
MKWIECSSEVKSFRLEDEPELIHVIKTGFNDEYMVVREDAYELNSGKVIFGTKIEIEKLFGISLGSDDEIVELFPKSEYPYEILITDEGTPFEINSWIPITMERIKDPDRIDEYITEGLINS